MIYYRDITIDRERMIIARGDDVVEFGVRPAKGGRPSPSRFKMLCALILGDGYTKDELIEFAWSGDPNGGPLTSSKVIDVWLFKNKALFARLGFFLVTEDRYRKRYRLEPIC